METLHNGFRSIRIYNVVDANVLRIDALYRFKVQTARLPILLYEFSARTEAVLHLQLPTVQDSLITIPDAEINGTEKRRC